MTTTVAKPNTSILRQVPELVSDEARLDPFPWFSHMRKTAPIRYDEHRQCWDLFSFEAVSRVISDPSCFSSQRGAIGAFSDGLVNLDPPRHTKLRALVNKAFTPASSAALGPRIQALTDELLEAPLARGEIDVIAELAGPLPITVIAELLGVPRSERAEVKQWSEIVVKGAHDSSKEAAAELRARQESSFASLTDYFKRAQAARRLVPGDDLVSKLVHAEIDGERLTEREIVGFCILLFVAGNETTTHWLGNLVRILVDEPAVQARMAQDLSLVPTAVQEVLRYRSATFGVSRISAKKQELFGHELDIGDWVVCWIASANRDEAKFDRADTFVPERAAASHLTFGHGPHYCLGAPLARLEAQIVANTLLSRTRNMRASAPMIPLPTSIMYGLRSLPIAFDRA